jgi:cytochrome P450
LIAAARASQRYDSLLAQLVRVRDAAGKGLDDRQIRDHAMTIFLAAYEPTATGLTWILHLLAKHPEVQRRLQAEVDEYASRPEDSAATDGAAQLYERPYMTQVIQESLRLYPSTWLMTRQAIERDELPSGASIPAGAEVFASPLIVHRDPRRYDAPEEFRPERFAEGAVALRAAGDYFPFGLGPAACLGEYLARLMMGATVEAILGRFSLISDNAEEPQMSAHNMFTMQPDRPVRLRLAVRAQATLNAAAA